MTPTILVPLDGSPQAENGVPVALSIARNLDGAVELAWVQDQSQNLVTTCIESFSHGHQDQVEWGRSYLNQVARRIEDVVPVRVAVSLLKGPLVRSLREHLAVRAPALMVISIGRPATRTYEVLGAASGRLIRHAPCPVVVVPPQNSSGSDLVDLPALRRIMIPLDGSSIAEQSLGWALRIGRAAEATYTLLRVVPPPLPTSSYLSGEVVDTARHLEVSGERASVYLRRLAVRIEHEGSGVETQVLVGVPTHLGILRYATMASQDLIVMTTHGLGGLWRVMLGSVAEKVVRGTSVPVLLLHPSEHHWATDTVSDMSHLSQFAASAAASMGTARGSDRSAAAAPNLANLTVKRSLSVAGSATALADESNPTGS